MGLHWPCKSVIGVRSPNGPPILSLCNVNLVDGLIWSQEAVRSNRTMETKLSPISIMEVHRFCNPRMAVRFCHGAPSYGEAGATASVIHQVLGCEQQIQKFNF